MYAVIAKCVLKLLGRRLNVIKLLQNDKKAIVQFGLASSSISGIFLLTRWLICKLRLGIGHKLEVFISGFLSSAAFSLLEKGD